MLWNDCVWVLYDAICISTPNGTRQGICCSYYVRAQHLAQTAETLSIRETGTDCTECRGQSEEKTLHSLLAFVNDCLPSPKPFSFTWLHLFDSLNIYIIFILDVTEVLRKIDSSRAKKEWCLHGQETAIHSGWASYLAGPLPMVLNPLSLHCGKWEAVNAWTYFRDCVIL